MKKILAWHFTDGLKLRDGQKLIEGKTYTFEGTPKLCMRGYHASRKAIDALTYAPGCQISRVELWGKVQEDENKLVAQNCTVLWTADATMILHEFACQCAEVALANIKNPDPRSVAAIETKRRWMRGEATDEELSATHDAAWDAAWEVAQDAAWSAAQSAAWSAAWEVAQDELNACLEALLARVGR